MRRRLSLRGTLLAASLAVAWPAGTARADFSAAGRVKKPKPGVAKPSSAKQSSTTKASTAQPSGSKPGSGASRSETGGAPGPSSEALIARYTGIVLSQPGSPFPMQRLAQLYRDRDGNLDALIADLTPRAAESWNGLVALAGAYQQAGKLDLARVTFEQAAAQKPQDSTAPLALARLAVERGDKLEARSRFDQALPLVKDTTEQEQILRQQLTLSLDAEDYAAAKKIHTELVRRANGSFFVRAELARELLLRGKYVLAEQECRAVVQFAAGDSRALAPALRDLGRALAKQGKREEAISTLKKALQAAGGQPGLRREIFEVTVELYRSEDRLTELIALMEAEGGRDFERLRLLGELYEENGQIDKAVTTYRTALGSNPGDLGVRLRLVQLLQMQGELDAAVEQHEHLVRAAPNNPDFAFQLAEALLQQGQRARALRHLSELERRAHGDEDALAALVEFYERMGEKERALALLEQLSQSGAGDPRHLVELGARYYDAGDAQKAERVWRRILVVVPNRASAYHALGEVLLEHDMADKALDALRTAMEADPRQARYLKAYALALERAGASDAKGVRQRRYAEALKIWQALLQDGSSDDHARREARQHIVTLWALGGHAQDHIPPLEQRLQFSPPDLEAGRLLAEVYTRLRRHADAERVLRLVIKQAPGDVASYGQLERSQVTQRKFADGIKTLEALVAVDPQRAREYYQRMALYAAEAYDDEAAIRYAAKAVELNPDDALGHKKLGEMYRRRQDVPRAIAEFWRAIGKNDRLFDVYVDLAELLLAQEQAEEADKLLRRVVRSARDEELVSRAAHLSMQINLGRGTLESLERELLPIALSQPQRPLYRRLVVEIYGALAFPLIQVATTGEASERRGAQEQLAKIGNRAVKLLLDALNDDRNSQQKTAIELLSHLENASAAPALVAYAQSDAPSSTRVRAMVAAGTLADDTLLPRLVQALERDGKLDVDGADPVKVAAVWGIVRVNTPASRQQLRRLLTVGAPSVEALAALGLGLGKEHRDAQVLTDLIESPAESQVVRVAAGLALTGVHPDARESARAGASLLRLAQQVRPGLRESVLVALACLNTNDARKLIAQDLVSSAPASRAAGQRVAGILVSGQYTARGSLKEPPTQGVDIEWLLDQFAPVAPTAEEQARALILLEAELLEAMQGSSLGDAEQMAWRAESFLARQGKPALAPLTDQLEEVAPELRRQTEGVAARLSERMTPAFVELVAHPSSSQRAIAVRYLASRVEPAAISRVSAAVFDEDLRVQHSVLVSIAQFAPSGVAPSVGLALADRDLSWATRSRAAEALGSLAVAEKDNDARDVMVEQLGRAALEDPMALVREAAALALGKIRGSATTRALQRVAETDKEPRLRELASRLLAETPE